MSMEVKDLDDAKKEKKKKEFSNKFITNWRHISYIIILCYILSLNKKIFCICGIYMNDFDLFI